MTVEDRTKSDNHVRMRQSHRIAKPKVNKFKVPVEILNLDISYGSEHIEHEQDPKPSAKISALSPGLALLDSVRKNAGTSYASYSGSIYFEKAKTHQPPEFTPNLARIESSAKLRLPAKAYDYAAGGAGLESTVAANREAFDHWKIVPRMLQNVVPQRNLSRRLFGRTVPAPIVMAPIGVQTLFHPTGERAMAKVFGEMGLPYTLSTASSTGFKDVATANGEGNPRWYQLYWPTVDGLTRSYLNSAKKHGYEVLVVTVDTWELAWRPRDLETGCLPFLNSIGTQIGLEDEYAHEQLGFDPLAEGATTEQKQLASLYHIVTTSRGISPRWENLRQLREWWGKGPVVLKGIQSVDDALAAVAYGMDGIIVSNHGGRQVDGAIGSLDCLAPIVDAVKGKLMIGFDGGIRTGADIFKALAIGADFVQLGRPMLWGLAHDGEKGARHVLKSILADFDLTVGLSGHQDLSTVNRTAIVASH